MIDKNDPKLTAFALNELTDDEYSEIESEVNSNAELKAEIEAIRKIAEDVSEILSIEQNANSNFVADTPREIDSPTQSKSASISTRQITWRLSFAGIASAIVVVCIIIVTIINQYIDAKKIAQNEKSTSTKTSEHTFDSNKNLNQHNLSAEITSNGKIISHSDSISQTGEIEIAIDNTNNDSNNDSKDNTPNGILLNEPTPTRPVLNTPKARNDSNFYQQGKNSYSSFPPILIKPDQNNNSQNLFGEFDLRNQNSNQKLVSLPTESNAGQTQTTQSLPQNQVVLSGTANPRRSGEEKFQGEKTSRSPRTTATATSSPPVNRLAKTNAANISGGQLLSNSDETLSSYEIMRQSINGGKLPSENEIKIDEYVNNFRYNYSESEKNPPFIVQTDIIQCPWNKKHLLARVGIKKLSKQISDNKIKDKTSDQSGYSPFDKTENIKVVIKFDKNKISDYTPINKIKVENEKNKKTVADNLVAPPSPDLKNKEENNKIIEIHDVEKIINLKDEVTFLYEIIPADQSDSDTLAINKNNVSRAMSGPKSIENTPANASTTAATKKEENAQQNDFNSGDYFSVELQDKELNLNKKNFRNENTVGETQFAAAVALYGLLLQKNGKIENCDWNTVKSLAAPNAKNDEQRKEFLKLIEKAENLNK
jgi:hypothetical protein